MRNALPPGATVFIDANIFLYRILEHWKYAQPCTELPKDVNRGKYSVVSSNYYIDFELYPKSFIPGYICN
jgi:hypothetical protein